jgi:hypothetical protein
MVNLLRWELVFISIIEKHTQVDNLQVLPCCLCQPFKALYS